MESDYVIVGSGITGATIARVLVDNGCDVVVLERRNHVGGNVHDHIHKSGVRIHTYGPHFFRTSSTKIWEFVNRFASFYPFEAVVMTMVENKLEYWPIQEEYIRRKKVSMVIHMLGIANFEEACLSMMSKSIYMKFVYGYTKKQWGVFPRNLNAKLAKRFDVRSGDKRLKTDLYQGIPRGGYTKFMESLLDGIQVVTNIDYLAHRDEFIARKKLIFTGPIDEYFGFSLGHLKYRGQQREHRHFDHNFIQPVSVINHPQVWLPTIRAIEWKHMMEESEIKTVKGTVITTETPFSPTDPNEFEYPFPDQENRELYLRYRGLADTDSGLVICGRLGEFCYYDMDQAMARALVLADRILESS